MQILDNVRNTVKDDLQVTIKKGSKISVKKHPRQAESFIFPV